MSITLADVLRLPSMAGAEVLSGHNSLLQPVESINVLEYAEISDELEQFFSSNHYEGSELIITAFANIRNDIETQCEILGGIIALVLWGSSCFMWDFSGRKLIND